MFLSNKTLQLIFFVFFFIQVNANSVQAKDTNAREIYSICKDYYHWVNKNYDIWSIEQAEKSIDLKNYSPSKNKLTAFIIGNEVYGVKQKIIDITNQVIEIPQEGTKHSINVSVVSGILCWDFYLKINA